MLFTHFGVSGPVILSLSRTAVACLDAKQRISLAIDLKPALDHKKLDQRLLREIQEHGKQHVKALLERLLPKSLIDLFSWDAGYFTEEDAQRNQRRRTQKIADAAERVSA